MKEIRDIIQAYEKALVAGKKTALATVVNVKGSSYRKPGARMLVTEDGHLTGSISGGCLEGDALNKARLTIQESKNRVVTYDTSDEEDTQIGIGLGCQGVIDILFEPLLPENPNNPVHLLKRCTENRGDAVLVTLFNSEKRQALQRGTCFLYHNENVQHSALSETKVETEVLKYMSMALAVGASQTKKLQTGETAFFGLVHPPISIIIFGAGNDVAPLARIGNILGWETTVIDGRNNYATAERFPGCAVYPARPEAVLKKIHLDKRTAVLLMTHNYQYDLAVLRQLAGKGVGYIGSLGPGKKLDLMLEQLTKEHIDFSRITNLHGPTGLDIGSETPEEIALSITAEIQSVLTGRCGKPLRQKQSGMYIQTIAFNPAADK